MRLRFSACGQPSPRLVRAQTRGRGIWAVDRGGDRRKLLEPLLERRERFVIRSTGQRMVLDRRRHRVTLDHLGACCRLRYQAQIVKIENGQEKVHLLRYGAEPFRLYALADGIRHLLSRSSPSPPPPDPSPNYQLELLLE